MGCLHPVNRRKKATYQCSLRSLPAGHPSSDSESRPSRPHHQHDSNGGNALKLKVMVKMNFEHLFDVVGFSYETQNNTVLFFVAYLKSNSLYKLILSFLP